MKINNDILSESKLNFENIVLKGNVNPTYQKFGNTNLKLAIQKNGELTKPTLQIYSELFGLNFSLPKNRELFTFEQNNNIALIWSRNKSIYRLVNQGAVDFAIIGSDQLTENTRRTKNNVVVIKNFCEVAEWPLVMALANQNITDISQIRTIATQYPKSAKIVLKKMGLKPRIIAVEGGTEVYAYLRFNEIPIDAIIDMSITGETIRQNGLLQLEPHLATYHPVLIANIKSVNKIKSALPKLFLI